MIFHDLHYFVERIYTWGFVDISKLDEIKNLVQKCFDEEKDIMYLLSSLEDIGVETDDMYDSLSEWPHRKD